MTGSFTDTGGLVNQPETESFRVEEAVAELVDPVQYQVIDREELNSRSYIDVTFNPINGQAVNPESILDGNAEFTITGGSGDNIEVDGAPVRLYESDVYRYFFTGKLTSADVTVEFIAESWEDTSGNKVTADYITSENVGEVETTDGVKLKKRTYIDVKFTPTNARRLMRIASSTVTKNSL